MAASNDQLSGRQRRIASLVFVVLVGGSNAAIARQVFTPTRAPRTEALRLAAPEEDKGTPSQKVRDRDARRILEDIKEEATLALRLAETERVDALEGRRPADAEVAVNRARDIARYRASIRRAIVDLSVADSTSLWRDAAFRGLAAAGDLNRKVASSTSITAEACAPAQIAESGATTVLPPRVEQQCAALASKERLTAAVTDLAAKAASGPPAGFQTSTEAASLLPGAGVAQTDKAQEVALRVAEFFFSNHWRLYLHSTLTVNETEPESDPENAPAAAAEPDPNQVAESVKAALLNPYGAPLYLTAGHFSKIRTPMLQGDANDANHGLFLDNRLGMKFVPLPEEGLTLKDAKTANTPFFVASSALLFKLPVYKDPPLSESAGGIAVALTAAVNRVANASASTLFSPGADGSDPLVPRTIGTLHLAVGIGLPSVANVVISGTLWSNSKFDRRFTIALNLQKDDPKPAGGVAQ